MHKAWPIVRVAGVAALMKKACRVTDTMDTRIRRKDVVTPPGSPQPMAAASVRHVCDCMVHELSLSYVFVRLQARRQVHF